MRFKVTQTFEYSVDGRFVTVFEAGKEYEEDGPIVGYIKKHKVATQLKDLPKEEKTNADVGGGELVDESKEIKTDA